jgi:hypothetical protein
MQQFVRRVLMAFVVFIAVASATRGAAAATLVQDQNFGLLGFFSQASQNYILFNPSLGTLTGIEFVLTSQILEPQFADLLATVSVNGNPLISLTGVSDGTPIIYNFTQSVPSFGFGLFTGNGSFPVDYFYFAGCAPCSGVGWSGDFKVTYTYDVAAIPEVPLPATLPLFATGLGVLGLLGWRRKRKASTNRASWP